MSDVSLRIALVLRCNPKTAVRASVQRNFESKRHAGWLNQPMARQPHRSTPKDTGAASYQKHLGPTAGNESALCTHQQEMSERWPWRRCIDIRSFRPNKMRQYQSLTRPEMTVHKTATSSSNQSIFGIKT